MQEPDTGCIAETSQVSFYSPGNTLMSPGATALADLLDSELRRLMAGGQAPDIILRILAALILPVQLLAVLVVFPVVWAVSWLVMRIRKQTGEESGLARIAPWFGALNAAVAFLFALFVLIQTGFQLMGAGEMQSLVGVSRSFIWIYTLPWVIAALAVVLTVISVVSWTRRYWGLARRIYFSFTTLAALLFVLTMAAAGMFGVLFS